MTEGSHAVLGTEFTYLCIAFSSTGEVLGVEQAVGLAEPGLGDETGGFFGHFACSVLIGHGDGLVQSGEGGVEIAGLELVLGYTAENAGNDGLAGCDKFQSFFSAGLGHLEGLLETGEGGLIIICREGIVGELGKLGGVCHILGGHYCGCCKQRCDGN